MKKDYDLRNILSWTKNAAIAILVLVAFSFTNEVNGQTTYAKGYSVCENTALQVSLGGPSTKALTYFGLYHVDPVTSDYSLVGVLASLSLPGSGTFPDQYAVGLYEVYSFSTNPPDDNTIGGTLVPYDPNYDNPIYIYPNPTLSGVAPFQSTVCHGEEVFITLTGLIDGLIDGDHTIGCTIDGNSGTYFGTASGGELTFSIGSSYSVGSHSVTIDDLTVEICTSTFSSGNTTSFTVEAIPTNFSASLQYSFTPSGTYYDVAGDLSGGYSMCIHPDWTYFYLDVKAFTSTPDINLGYPNPFYVDYDNLTNVAEWLDYWENVKNIPVGSEPWKIVTGERPIFYLYTADGIDYQIIDGYQYQFEGGVMNPLRVDGNYPEGIYPFIGTVQSGTAGCTSADITMTMDFSYGVWNTTQNKMYCTIQDAVDDANTSGDIIKVAAGTYAESVYVDKSVELRGPNYGVSGTSTSRVDEAVIHYPDGMTGGDWADIFYVVADNVIIDGFTLSDEGFETSIDPIYFDAVYSEEVSNIVIANNIIDGFNYTSVLLNGGAFPTSAPIDGIEVTNNYVINNYGDYSSIYLQGVGGDVTGNTVENATSAIQIQPYAQPIGGTVSNNDFSATISGIYYNYAGLGSGKWTFTGNDVSVASLPSDNIIVNNINGKGSSSSSTKSRNIEKVINGTKDAVDWIGIYIRTFGTSSTGTPPEVEFSGNNTVDGSAALSDPFWNDVIGIAFRNNNAGAVAKIYNNTIGNTDMAIKTYEDVHNITIDLDGNNLNSYSQFAIVCNSDNDIDASTGNTFDGVASGSANLAELFAIEDDIVHKIDESTRGLVTVTDGELYVTELSYAGAETAPSIQRGIDAASAGWTVHVEAGEYAERVVVDKSLTLLGPNQGEPGNSTSRNPEAIIHFPDNMTGDWWAGVIDILADDVTIDGFLIDDEGFETSVDPEYFTGIHSGHYDLNNLTYNNTVVKNNIVSGFNYCSILLQGGSNSLPGATGALVDNNYASNCSDFSSIYLQNTAGTVSHNKVENGARAIQIQPYGNTTGGSVYGNEFNGYATGIYYNYAQKGAGKWTIYDNDISAASAPTTGTSWTYDGAWQGISLRTFGNQGTGDLPEVEFYGNTINGSAASSTNPYWSAVRGVEIINAIGIADFHENTIINSETGVYVHSNSDVSSILVNNNNIENNSNYGIENMATSILDATCNWWGTPEYETIYDYNTGLIIYAPFLLTNDIDPLTAVCEGGPALPDNLTLTYNAASQDILVAFNVTENDLELQPIPGLDPEDEDDYLTILGLYQNLGAALANPNSTTEEIQAAALAVGDDIITEYWYLDESNNKVYLKGALGNDLVKNKYWSKYLVRYGDDLRFPDWTLTVPRTLVTDDNSYRTHTNPETEAVVDGWLSEVLGKDVHVTVTFINNGSVNFVTGQVSIDPGPVKNTTTFKTYLTITEAIEDVATENGHTLEVSPHPAGSFDEQVVVNKQLTITGIGTGTKGAGTGAPVIDFTGTVTGAPSLFYVTVPNVTINNFVMQVDLTKLGMAVLGDGTAGDLDNIAITNNTINPYGSSSAGSFSYANRNAVNINYGDYRGTAYGGVDNIVFTNNTITGSADGGNGVARFFRSGISTDESGGLFTSNTIQSINHDILVRFASNGDVTVSGNNLNGGGMEFADFNAGAGTLTISGNTFNGAFANTYSNALRLKNNTNAKTTLVSNNTFTGFEGDVAGYGGTVSLENYQAITIDNNTFTPLANSTVFRHITLNTKDFSSSSGYYAPVVGATLTNNTFNGSGTPGGVALAFYNWDDDSPTFNAITIGTTGNENTFNEGIASYILLDNSTGAANPNATTMAPWSVNLDATNNFFAASPPTLPASMTLAELFSLEDKIQHAIDDGDLGFVTVKADNAYVTENSFVAPATTTPSIQRGIDAAGTTGWTVNVSDGEYNESILIDKSLALLGPNSNVSPVDGIRNLEATITGDMGGAQAAILIGDPGVGGSPTNISGVTIKGFEIANITNTSGGNACIGAGQNFVTYSSADNVTIEKMYIHTNSVASGIYTNSNIIMNGWTITDNKFENLTAPLASAINPWKQDNLTITNNEISNIAYSGINAASVTGGSTISGNSITNVGQAGIQVAYASGYPTTNLTITQNTIDQANTSEEADKGGIRLYGGTEINGYVNITENIITNSYNGVAVRDGEVLTAGVYHVNYNSITGNDNYAVYNGGTGTLDVTCNWWGPGDASDIEDIVSGDVDFLPFLEQVALGNGTNYWWDTGYDYSCDGEGPVKVYDGDPDIPGTLLISSHMTIQDGIDAAAEGDFITVAAGNYPESLEIYTDDITIRGPNYGIDPNGTVLRTTEAIIQPSDFYGFYIEADGITFDGFTMDGLGVCDYGIYAYTETGQGNLLVSNNIIKNLVTFGFIGYVQTGPASSVNYVVNNLFDFIEGRAIVPLWNYYANISYNTIQNSTIGIYAENAHIPESTGTVEWKYNTISTSRSGIWYNLVYGTATPMTISNNTISVEDNLSGTRWDGIWLTSLGGSINPIISGNIINGAAVTQQTNGYNLWNNTTTATDGITIQGGTVDDVDYGVWINNWDGYPTSGSNAGSTSAKIKQVAITDASLAGIYLKDNSQNTNGTSAFVYANLEGVSITTAGTGILVEGADASFDFSGTAPQASISSVTDYIVLQSNTVDVPANNVDATQVQFDGTYGSGMSTAQLFAVEDKIDHKIDLESLGFVKVNDLNTYVTEVSFVSPETTPSIQRGINAAGATGWTVNVNDGTYTEDVLVDKSITIIGQGVGSTTVQPTAPANVAFTVSADNVTIKDLKITEPTGLVNGIDVVSPAAEGLWVENVHFINMATATGANAYGINVKNSFDDLDVVNCQFKSPALDTYTRGIGVFAGNGYNLYDFDITGSKFENLFVGIYFRCAIDDLYIYDNTFGPFELNDCTAAVAGVYIGDGDDDNFDIENVTVTGNTFTSFGRGVYVWNYGANSAINNFDISGNTFTNSIWSSPIRFILGNDGMADYTIGGTNGIVIDDNTFTQNSDIGGNVALVDLRTYDANLLSCNVSVTNNNMTFTGAPYADAMYGIKFTVGGDAFYNTTISGNTINGGNTGGSGVPPSTGIAVTHYSADYMWAHSLDLEITDNTLTGFDDAVNVYDLVNNLYGGLPAGSLVNIEENDLSANNVYGVHSGLGATLDATCNYWGSYSCAEIETEVEGNVDYLPFSNSTFSSCSFNCSLPVVWVDDSWLGTTPGTLVDGHTFGYDAFAVIQDGVDAVDEDGTVNVAAGSYQEQVNIEKALVLQGEDKTTTTILTPEPNTMVIYDHYGSKSPNSRYQGHRGANIPVVRIASSDVTVKNFTVDLNNKVFWDILGNYTDPTYSRSTAILVDHVETTPGDISTMEKYTDILIDNNIITNMLENDGGDAIKVLAHATGVISYNKIDAGSQSGISILGTTQSTFTPAGPDFEINYNEVYGGTFEVNAIGYGFWGVGFWNNGEGKAYKNVIYNNPTFATIHGSYETYGLSCWGNNPGLIEFVENEVYTDGTGNVGGVGGYQFRGLTAIWDGNIFNDQDLGLIFNGATNCPTATLQNNIFEDCIAGILIEGMPDGCGSLTINDNKFINITNLALESETGNQFIDAKYNWWNDATGPDHVLNPCGAGHEVLGDVDFSPWYYEASMSTLNGLPDVVLTPMPGISAVTNAPIILTVDVDYPTGLTNYNDDVKVDALIEAAAGFPADAQIISIEYNDAIVYSGTYPLTGTQVYLSDILGAPAPTQMNGHENADITWEIIIDGVTTAGTTNIHLESISYITDYNSCNNVLAEDDFSVTFADATLAILADAFGCDDATELTVDITYPAITNLHTDILTDAKITSNKAFTGAQITSIKLGSSPNLLSSPYTLDGTQVYLSEMLGESYPLQGHVGTDSWTINIEGVAPEIYEVTIEAIARIGTDYGVNEYAYTDDSHEIQFYNIVLDITPMVDIYTATSTPVIITMIEQYPTMPAYYAVGDDEVLNDARLSTTVPFPTNAYIIGIKFNDWDIPMNPYPLDGLTSMYLSDIPELTANPLIWEDVIPNTWEITIIGMDVATTYPVTVEALAYVDQGVCESVLGSDYFTMTFANAVFNFTQTSVDVCGPDYIAEFDATMQYPTISGMHPDVLTNNELTSDVDLPAGTIIDWDYNSGAASGSHTLAAATSNILLSQIVNDDLLAVEGNSLQGHVGTDDWGFIVTIPGPVDDLSSYTITGQPIAQLNSVNYDYSNADDITLNYYEQPLANAGSGGYVCVTDFAQDGFTFTAVRSVPTTGSGLWTLDPGAPGTADFVDATDPVTSVTVTDIGLYIFRWTESNVVTGCTSSDTVHVRFNPDPTPEISGNDEVFGGTTEVYQTDFVTDHTYAWSVSNNGTVIDPGISNHIKEITWDEVTVATTATVTVTETSDKGCVISDVFNVTITPVGLKGTITYNNSSNTPMSNVDVRLIGGTTYSTTTDASGFYKFNTVPNGTYTLEVETGKAWGGGNSTDALAIQRTALFYQFPWWHPEDFLDNVGDVNASNSLSSLDALQVKQRTVYLINSFSAGDWAFWHVIDPIPENNNGENFTNPTGTANIGQLTYEHNGATTFDIEAMCYGDVNGSYQPPSYKSLYAVPSESVMNVIGKKQFKLPVRLIGDHAIGAMTIHLQYDDYLMDVVDLKSEIPGMLYTIENGWINVAWAEVEPLDVPSGGTLFTLVVEAKEDIDEYDELFKVNNETQFAGMHCQILEDVHLSIDKVNAKYKYGIEEMAGLYALECFPNPMKESTNIAYALPERGQVKILIVNSLGEVVTKLVDDTQEAGNYNLNFRAGEYGLGTGVYYCKMVVDGENSEFSDVIRIVYMK